MPDPPRSSDPVLVRRAQVARITRAGRRTGYGLIAAAVAAFAVGAAAGFTSAEVVVVVACIAVGSVLLAPSIVLGHAVMAAEREDRERAVHRPPSPS